MGIVNSCFVKLQKPKVSRKILFAAEIFIFLAICLTLLVILHFHPISLTLFMMIAQPFFVIGMALYVLYAIVWFFAHHGTSQISYAPGEIIFREGDKGEFVYSIIHGNVEIIKEIPGEREKVVNKLGPGDYFGEMALIANRPRSAKARAVNSVKAMTISHRDFINLHENLPALKEDIDTIIQSRTDDLEAKGIGTKADNSQK